MDSEGSGGEDKMTEERGIVRGRVFVFDFFGVFLSSFSLCCSWAFVVVI